MIKGWRHKGLKSFFENGNKRRIASQHSERIARILDVLDGAAAALDLALPGFRLHPLKGRRARAWAVTVSGNWRITFRFEGGHAYDVNLEDYH